MNRPQSPHSNEGGDKRAFLGIHFINCGVYGRIYKITRETPMLEDARGVHIP